VRGENVPHKKLIEKLKKIVDLEVDKKFRLKRILSKYFERNRKITPRTDHKGPEEE
jgi:hypothetical protein